LHRARINTPPPAYQHINLGFITRHSLPLLFIIIIISLPFLLLHNQQRQSTKGKLHYNYVARNTMSYECFRKISLSFIEDKDDGSGVDKCSYTMCRLQSCRQIITTNQPTPNVLQAGCPFCRPTNMMYKNDE